MSDPRPPERDAADEEETAVDASALADRIDDLEAAVADLRAARERGRPSRGPLGLPRPPTPREFVAFAVEDAIPATVALLDAQIRALEALRAALRLARPGLPENADDGRRTTRRAALSRLNDAVADLREAAAGPLPVDGDARDLLAEARELTADLQAEVEDARGERAERGERARDRERADRADREERAERVEDELDQLRDEYDGEESA